MTELAGPDRPGTGAARSTWSTRKKRRSRQPSRCSTPIISGSAASAPATATPTGSGSRLSDHSGRAERGRDPCSRPPRRGGRGVPEGLRGHAPDERVLVVEPPEERIDGSRSGIGRPSPFAAMYRTWSLLVLEQGDECRGDPRVADSAEGLGRTVAHDPGWVTECRDQGGNRLRIRGRRGRGTPLPGPPCPGPRGPRSARVRPRVDRTGQESGRQRHGRRDRALRGGSRAVDRRRRRWWESSGGHEAELTTCCCWRSSISFIVFSASSFILAEIRFEAENSTVRIAFAISEPSTKIAVLVLELALVGPASA